MPFCTNCGTNVDGQAAFCRNCGSPQPVAHAGPPPQYTDFLAGLSDRTACLLCYIPVFGVIPAIVFLASQKYRMNVRVRFDAFQSLYLFVTWLIVSALGHGMPIFGMGGHGMETALAALFKMAIFIASIYLLVKASQQQQTRLPIIGDLAARSAAEQL